MHEPSEIEITYKDIFIAKEKTFRPREDFKHEEVIQELSKILDSADEAIRFEKKLKNYYYDKLSLHTGVNNILSIILIIETVCLITIGFKL